MQDTVQEKIEFVQQAINKKSIKTQLVGQGRLDSNEDNHDLKCYIYDLTGKADGRLLIITADNGKTIDKDTMLNMSDMNFAIKANDYSGVENLAKDVLNNTFIQQGAERDRNGRSH